MKARIISYAGPARRYPPPDTRGSPVTVLFLEETDFSLIEFVQPNAENSIPFPFVLTQRDGVTYLIEYDKYCEYHDICHVCCLKDCDKMCVPDFAANN